MVNIVQYCADSKEVMNELNGQLIGLIRDLTRYDREHPRQEPVVFGDMYMFGLPKQLKMECILRLHAIFSMTFDTEAERRTGSRSLAARKNNTENSIREIIESGNYQMSSYLGLKRRGVVLMDLMMKTLDSIRE